MDNPLPKGFAASAQRVKLARSVASANPRDLIDAITDVWPAKLGKAQALAHARALVDKLEAGK